MVLIYIFWLHIIIFVSVYVSIMSAKFYLDKPNDERSVVVLKFRRKQLVFVCSTGLYIQPRVWNKKTQRIKTVASYPTHMQKNKFLDALANVVDAKYYDSLANGKICTKELLRATVDEFLNKSAVDESRYVDVFFQRHIDNARVSIRTLKNKRRLLNTFKEHQSYMKRRYTFEDIDYKWFTSFVNWSYDVKKAQSGYVDDNIKRLRSIFKEARIHGLHSNLAYLDFKVEDRIKKYQKKSHFALTEQEIQLLYDAELYDEAAIVRDICMLLYYTGFRYSDYDSLKKNDFKTRTYQGKEVFTVTSINAKGKKLVENPVPSKLMTILENYDFDLPKRSLKHINETVKELYSDLELDEMVSYCTDHGGITKVITEPKHQLVSCHTFRRSIITNLKKYGLSLQDRGGFAGQSSIKVTEHYDKESATEKALRLSENPFFSEG